MLARLLVLLGFSFFATSAFAQQKKIQELKNQFWGKNDPYKDITTFPEKWENESAVILYQEFNYNYEGNVRSVDYSESIRKRIKLLDKSSVEEFSEFSFVEAFRVERGFYSKGGRVFAGFKIIKPDGTEEEISMDNAVELKGDSNEKLKKIAIPGLEIGDIIDYYYYIYEPFKALEEYIFEPVVSTLNATYPVVKQKLSFEVEKSFFVSFNSYNGAPKLQEFDLDKKKRYTLEDEDRDKSDDIRWFYPRRVLPVVKFQVVYARKNRMERSADAFLGEDGEVKKSVSETEIRDYYSARLGFDLNTKFIDKHISQKNINRSDKNTLLEEVYYFLRYDRMVSKIEPILFFQQGYITYLPYTYGNFIQDLGFVNLFGSYLASKNIPFDVIVAAPRFLSALDQVLIKDELTLMLRVNLKEPIYISKFYVHSNFGKIPNTYEGTEAYEIAVSPKRQLTTIQKVQLPVSSMEENKSREELNITIPSADMSEISVVRNSYHTGYNKIDAQSSLLNEQDYLSEDYAYFNIPEYIERAGLKKKSKDQVAEKIEAQRKKDLEDQKERFQNSLEGEYGFPVKSYDSYNIESTGRFNDSPGFAYKEVFKIEELIKKAGKNYIFEIGKLIGEQVALKEEEMERKHTIYMPFARSYENAITIEIPEGYTVQGLDKLNINVDNTTGGFVSEAIVEGNQLKLTTRKFYHNNVEPASNWSDMVAFLEAAYQFTQEKILFKKG